MQRSLIFIFCVLLSLIDINDAIRQRILSAYKSKESHPSESSIINSDLVSDSNDVDGPELFPTVTHTLSCPIVESPQFLLVAQKKRISRINLADYKLGEMPVRGLGDVTAIEFDIKNNCLYWADSVNNTINRQCFKDGSTGTEILVKIRNSYITGMALDWVSNVLYFVDNHNDRIQIIRTDINTQDRMRRTILGPNNLLVPRGIAVHPKAGYLFWTNRSINPSVNRANLDGTNVKRLFSSEWPIGIAIDYISERIYYVDNRESSISYTDFDGNGFRRVIRDPAPVSYSIAVAVFKDNVYWGDWRNSKINVANKDHGAGMTSIIGQLAGLMDLKVFAHSVQTGTNKCKTNPCPYICLGAPYDTYVCLCPDNMVENAAGHCVFLNGKEPVVNSTCPPCSPNQFLCGNGICIPDSWKCNGDNDCGDGSDEAHCERMTCNPDKFGCDTNKCIPRNKLCDNDIDCLDGTDELNCSSSVLKRDCRADEFTCVFDKACIPYKWKCDGEPDCDDKTDEENCKNGSARNDELNFTIIDKKYSRVWEKGRIVSMTIDEYTITSTSFVLYWSIVGKKNNLIEYMPSIAKIAQPLTWTNATEWTQELNYRFTDLEPYTFYNAFVYSRRHTEVTKPHWYVTVKTLEGEPSEPLNVTVTHKNLTDAEVTWQPPQHPRGIISGYTVTFSPPSSATQIYTKETSLTVKVDPAYGYNFTFCVIAQNQLHKSSPSAKFLLVAQKKRISRINLADYKLEEMPVRGLGYVTAIEFDIKNNCLYWAEPHTISRQCFKNGSTGTEILIETDLGWIGGMALDLVSNVLYFVDEINTKIQIIRTDINTQDRMRRTILGPNHLQKPIGIAVHPEAGYMFWINLVSGTGSVNRANLDGTNIKRLVKSSVFPSGLTIDYISKRIYWVDANSAGNCIGYTDFDGNGLKRIFRNNVRISLYSRIAVFKDMMYWSDASSTIFVANKDDAAGMTSIIGQFSNLTDLKVIAHGVQTGSNQCKSNPCPYICLGAPNDTFVCLCPDNMVENVAGHCVCKSGTEPVANSTGPPCSSNQFLCDNGFCIPDSWKCNGDNDCGDESDEAHCERVTCSPDKFGCDTNKCIPWDKLCDLNNDCLDGTDELNCSSSVMKKDCRADEFTCIIDKVCIPYNWKCDGEPDCDDKTDEENCKNCSANVENSNLWEKGRIVSMTIDEYTITSSSLTLYWSVVGNKNNSIEYMPSIAKIEQPLTWTNATDWTQKLYHRFTDLEPYTSYHAFIYSRRHTKVTKPFWYVTARTLEGVPSEPWNVTVTQKNRTYAEVTWQPPQHPRGIISNYIVTFSPPSPATQIHSKETSLTVKVNPVYGYNYFTFWVIAQNQLYKSSPSAKVNLLLKGIAV